MQKIDLGLSLLQSIGFLSHCLSENSVVQSKTTIFKQCSESKEGSHLSKYLENGKALISNQRGDMRKGKKYKPNHCAFRVSNTSPIQVIYTLVTMIDSQGMYLTLFYFSLGEST